MRTIRHAFAAACGGVLLAALAACSGESRGTVIAVIPKGTTHEFWKSIHAGAAKAAQETGVELVWKGPQREDDREAQIKVVEDFVSRGVSGIVLAPMDETALAPVVREATAEGIPVLIVDSGLKDAPQVSFVATDNFRGGVLAARRLGTLLEGGGKAILLRYLEGSASTAAREQGFLDTMAAEFAGVELVSTNQYAGATTESAYQTAENLLNRFADADGVFCPNESATMGMLRALQDAGRAGTVKFVGFDASEKLVAAVREGQIHGLVLQDPFKMGELGVKTMLSHLRNEAVEARIDTGVYVVTADNVETPEMVRLHSPRLDEYLK